MKYILMVLIASFFLTSEAFAVRHHTPPAARDANYSANPTAHLPDAILSPKAEEAAPQPEGDQSMDNIGSEEPDAPTTDVEEEAEPQQQ
jgi:hypothetical protein